MSGPVLIMGAMDEEIREMADLFDHSVGEDSPFGPVLSGRIRGVPAVLVRTGVGKVNAALCAQYCLLRHGPRALIFTGIAGGFGPGVEIGDTLVGRTCVQYDMDCTALGFLPGEVPYSGQRYFPGDPELVERALAWRPAAGRVHDVCICSGDQFITGADRAARYRLVDVLGGSGAEMEGAAVACAAAIHGVPCLVMRTVSDNADAGAPGDFQAFLPRAGRNSADFVQYLLEGEPEFSGHC